MFERLKYVFNNWKKNTIINLAEAVTKTLLGDGGFPLSRNFSVRTLVKQILRA